jgi:hypothetical protein
MDRVQLKRAPLRIWLVVLLFVAACLLIVGVHVANSRTLSTAVLTQWDYSATQQLWASDPTFRAARLRFWLAAYPDMIRFLHTGRAFTTDRELRMILGYRTIPVGRSLYDLMIEPASYGLAANCGLRDCVAGIIRDEPRGSCILTWSTGDADRVSWVRVPPPDGVGWEADQYYYAWAGYQESDALADVDEAGRVATMLIAVQVITVISALYAVIWAVNGRSA